MKDLNITEELMDALLDMILDMDHAGKGSPAKRHAEKILAKAEAAAPHLQAQPRQVSGILTTRALDAWYGDTEGMPPYDELQRESMGRVLRVAADELLAEPTPTEKEQMARDWHEHDTNANSGWDNYHYCTAKLLERRRARLFAPKAPEERFEVVRATSWSENGDAVKGFMIRKDGATLPGLITSESLADAARLGLIAQLKSDATLKEKEQPRFIHGEPVHLPANAVMGAEMLQHEEQL